MVIGFITDLSIKKTKKYIDDDGNVVKQKYFLQIGMIRATSYDPIK